jgi:hypothetical protein
MEKYGVSPRDTRASFNADESVHLEADVLGVLDVLALKHDVLALKHDELKKEFSEFREEFELMKRGRSLSIVSSSINVFTNRVLLWPRRSLPLYKRRSSSPC